MIRSRLEDLSKEELVRELRSALESGQTAEAGVAEREKLLLDLRIHQIELETQNRQLREVQGELEAALQRYRDLFETAPIAYCTLDAEGRILEINPKGVDLLGRARDVLLGARLSVAGRMKDAPPFLEHLRRCLASDVPVVDELVFLSGAGLEVFVQAVSSRVTDPRQQLRALSRTALIDVTDRKLAEAEIRRRHEAERTLRARVEAVVAATLAISRAQARDTDLDSVLRVVVEKARELTGADFGALGVVDAPGRPFSPWVQVGLSEERARLLGGPPRPVGVLGAVVDGGYPVRLDDVSQHPQFAGFPLDHPTMTGFMGVPLVHEGRNIGNLYLAKGRGGAGFTDEEVRAVEMLAAVAVTTLSLFELRRGKARQRAWLDSVIDQLPEGVLLADERGRVRWNRAARGFSIETGRVDASGNAVALDARLPTGEPVAWEELPVFRAARGETVSGEELVLHRSGGHSTPVLASAAPIEADTSRGAVAIFRDISVLKLVERMREQWTAIVAHDLRQPLGTILLTTNMIEHLQDVDSVREAAQRLRSAVRRLDRMVEDLLDQARVTAGQFTVRRGPFELARLVSGVLTRAHEAAGGAPIKLDVVPPGDPLLVQADADRIEQVLENLLSNAAKYGDPGTEILVRLERVGEGVRVSVTNRGPGLKTEEAANVFELGYRVPGAGQGSGGLGLGLYIARAIVQCHGGRIWVESKPGETTTFAFVLPVPR